MQELIERSLPDSVGLSFATVRQNDGIQSPRRDPATYGGGIHPQAPGYLPYGEQGFVLR
jgi:hypothetical protein